MARLTVWQPFSNVAMDAALDNMMRNAQALRARGDRPMQGITCDLTESDEGYTVYAALPGVPADDVTIDFVDGILTFKAEAKPTEAAEGVRYHLRERTGGHYERAFRFPVPINVEAISANYEDGILTVSLPKADSVKPRRIEVHTTA